MMKKILVIDDSALMRRVLCDIINADSRFQVDSIARDGEEALKLMSQKKFDAIILDINMPKMNGIEFLTELKERGVREKVIVVSTDTADGADVTIQALELGAFDFIQKPKNTLDSRGEHFRRHIFGILDAATADTGDVPAKPLPVKTEHKEIVVPPRGVQTAVPGKKLVALACSTGGPNALQHVIPMLPPNLNAPVLIVQHMPAGFTKSLAQRLNSLSEITVSEAQENDIIQKGHVYIAQGGLHMKLDDSRGNGRIFYSDEPTREGVKPCANYMYESLVNSSYDQIICVVLTGMGSDGTKGITALAKQKNVHIIAQSERTCTVYGMPKSIVATGKVEQIVDLDSIAQEIITNVGVR